MKSQQKLCLRNSADTLDFSSFSNEPHEKKKSQQNQHK